MIKPGFKFIDLFAGVGGFHQALQSLGGECVFASDIDKNCREVYLDNYGIVPNDDITKVDPKDVPKHNLICGGFPCQSFSKAGNRMGVQDPRGTLFFDVVRIAEYHKPEYLLLENVRNLAGHDSGRTWTTIYTTLKEIGYNLSSNPVIFSPHFIGIPQHRERVFIMAVREDLGSIPDFVFNVKNEKVECDVDDILLDDSEIQNLNDYKLSDSELSVVELWGDFIKGIDSPLPGFPVWADRLKELDLTEDLDEHPKWKSNFILKNNQLYIENRKFLDRWLQRAYSNPNFKGSKAMFEWQAGKQEEPNIWDNILQFRPSGLRVKKGTYFPALVAITQTSIVGKRGRKLTPRECARLQSFPDDFRLSKKDAVSYKQFGNSVNVEVVRLFAKFLLGDEDVRKKYSSSDLFSKS
jgi:DNA (cytosine-5)-methyltransferase 1